MVGKQGDACNTVVYAWGGGVCLCVCVLTKYLKKYTEPLNLIFGGSLSSDPGNEFCEKLPRGTVPKFGPNDKR